MEYLYSTILSLFLLIALPLLFLLYPKQKSLNTHQSLPPGKTGFPFIGESLAFLSSGWQGHPEKFILDRMNKYSSQVFKTSLFGEPAAVFCGAEGNKFLFCNENKLVTARWPNSINKIFPSTAKTSLNEESNKMRKLFPHFLKPEALQKYIAIMDDIAQRHFASRWEGKEEVLVFPLAKSYTFWLACKLFVSMEDPEHVSRLSQPFNQISSGIFSIPINLPGTPFRKAINASNFVRKELLKIIRNRKLEHLEGTVCSKQDILSHMLSIRDENGGLMNELDIADKILVLLIGGHDSTSAACTFIVKYLAELPHIYDQVYEEQMEIAKSKSPGDLLNWDDLQKMKYSWNVACEVLRLVPPLQGGFRETIKDFSFKGFYIPKGWKLYWSANSTHKSPEFFPEPKKFDPNRFRGNGPAPYTFVPFGGGPRMCPGKEYARLEILVFMHNLVKRLKWEKLLADEKIVVDPIPIPAKGLPIILHPH